MSLVEPIVGQWYFCRDTRQMFEVVSTDEDDKTVELQDYDGSLDEIERDVWYALHVEAIDPPEDLRGVFDTRDMNGSDDDLDRTLYDVRVAEQGNSAT